MSIRPIITRSGLNKWNVNVGSQEQEIQILSLFMQSPCHAEPHCLHKNIAFTLHGQTPFELVPKLAAPWTIRLSGFVSLLFFLLSFTVFFGNVDAVVVVVVVVWTSFGDNNDVEVIVSLDSCNSFFSVKLLDRSRLGAGLEGCNAEVIVWTIEESDTNPSLVFDSFTVALLESCVVETLSVFLFSFTSFSFCALELRASSTIFALASFNCLSKIFLRCSRWALFTARLLFSLLDSTAALFAGDREPIGERAYDIRFGSCCRKGEHRVVFVLEILLTVGDMILILRDNSSLRWRSASSLSLVSFSSVFFTWALKYQRKDRNKILLLTNKAWLPSEQNRQKNSLKECVLKIHSYRPLFRRFCPLSTS